MVAEPRLQIQEHPQQPAGLTRFAGGNGRAVPAAPERGAKAVSTRNRHDGTLASSGNRYVGFWWYPC
eukprot:5038406-Amphidinium_carterae.1